MLKHLKYVDPFWYFSIIPSGDLESVASLGAGENVTIPEDENNTATTAIDYMDTMAPVGLVSTIIEYHYPWLQQNGATGQQQKAMAGLLILILMQKGQWLLQNMCSRFLSQLANI